MNTLTERYHKLLAEIRTLEQQYQRAPGDVQLLAVSKGQPLAAIENVYALNQSAFAENLLKESLIKISASLDKQISWHFIGALQSNKLAEIAAHFDWVQSVSRIKEAALLAQHRTLDQAPLNLCIQIKLENNPNRGGIAPDQIEPLINTILERPTLRLRGLMCLPPFSEDFDIQRQYFNLVRKLYDQCLSQGYPLDTLSMGMSHDFAAAIAEGSTMVRIGQGLFGKRQD